MVAAILNNFGAVESSLETMTNSAGSAMKEMDIIENSLEFKLNALKETSVGVFQNLFQTNQMGIVIDALTGLLEILDFLTKKIKLLGTLVAGVGITVFVKSIS